MSRISTIIMFGTAGYFGSAPPCWGAQDFYEQHHNTDEQCRTLIINTINITVSCAGYRWSALPKCCILQDDGDPTGGGPGACSRHHRMQFLGLLDCQVRKVSTADAHPIFFPDHQKSLHLSAKVFYIQIGLKTISTLRLVPKWYFSHCPPLAKIYSSGNSFSYIFPLFAFISLF